MDINEITALAPEAVTPEQKQYLTENAKDLADDVAQKFGITKPAPEKIEPEVRPMFGTPEKSKEGDDIDPEDEAKISKVVSRYVTPLQQQSIDNQNSIEVDTFIRNSTEKFPFASKYRESILTYMKNPAYARIPAKNIFNIVAAEEMIKFGAEREREASTKAKSTRVTSSSARPISGGQKDWGMASKADFDAKRAEVMGRPN
jgi:hypothetical protein